MRISTSRSIAFVLGIALVVGTSGFLLQAEPPQEVGTWASIGTTDPQATRTGAAVATLPDRTTLVAGGLTAEGAATDSIVIHDPLTNSSTAVGQLLEPRVDAAATRLDDGRILITGGRVGSLISSDIEIFDLATGESKFASLLQDPRTGHASALLADGTVLIVGGTTAGGVVLATTERFDPSTNSVSAAEPMAVARTGASATTLIDGRVLVVGGRDGGAQDLKSAEIYSPVDGEFLSVPTQMSKARSGHSAVLLPHNNSVLIAGGISADTAVTTTDLFLPEMFPDPYSWGMGSFGPTDPEELARMTMVQPRSRAVAGPWGDDGYALAMGGGSGDGEVYRFATIKTDKDDYGPGEPAVITGSGWAPLEEVTLTLQEDPAVHDDYVLTLTADDEGNIYHDQWAPEEHDLSVRFYMMAMGGESLRRAQTTFTDGNARVRAIFLPAGPASAPIGWEFFNNATCTGTPSSTGSVSAGVTGNGASLPDATASESIRVTAGAVSGYAFSLWDNGDFDNGTFTTTSNPGCLLGAGNTQNTTVTYTAAVGPTKLAVTSVNGGSHPTYGNSFSVVVQSQNASSSATNVTAATGFTFSVATGDGTLTGTVSGTILAGQSSATVTGVTYSKAQNGVSLTATRTSGDTLTPGTSAVFNVLQRPVTLTGTRIYDGTTVAAAAILSVSNAVGGDIVTVVSGTATLASKDVGSRAITSVGTLVLGGAAAGNYTLTDATGSVEITQAAVTATAGGGSGAYNGLAQSPSACVVSGAYIGGLSCVNSPASVGPNIGTTAISPVTSGADLANFTVTPVDGSYTIDPALVTATAGGGSGTYNGLAQSPSACVVSGAYIGGLSCVNNPTSVGPNIGTTAISPVTSGADLANFTVTPVDGSYTIDPALVTATAGGGSGTYNGLAQSPSACVVSGAYIGGLSCVNSPASVGPNIGTTAISPVTSGADLANFTVTPVDGSYTIDPALVTATAGGGSGTYNGLAQSPSACVVSGAYIGGLSCVNNPASVGPNIGTTAISPVTSGADLANFTVTPVDGSYTIDPALVTATAGGGSGTYNGLAQSPSACVVSGAYIGGLSCVNSPASVGPNIGTTAISPVTSGADLANFTVTPVDGSYTIDPALVTATAGGGSGTYNGLAQSPSACVVSGAYIGGLSCVNSPASVGPNIGTTAISPVTSGADLANFTVTPVDGSYTIDPALVTATAGGGSGTYNGLAQSPSACVVSGAYIGGLSCVNSPASVGPNIGTTAISPVTSGADLANFTVTPVDGSYTIDPALVTATAGGGSGTYNGLAQSPSACVVSGAYIGGLSCVNSPASVGPNIGTTAISPVTSGADLANFTVTPVDGSYTIDPALVTATAGGGSGTYNGLAQSPSACVVSGAYIGGLSCVNSPASVGPNIGTTAISPVTSGADLANFTVTPVDGSYTIDPALVTATAGGGSGTYNGLAQSPSACVVSGAYIGGLSCVNNPASVGPNIGTTAISPVTSGADLANFTVTPVDGSYSIAKADTTTTVLANNAIWNGAPHGGTASWTSVEADAEGGPLPVSYVGRDGTVYPSSTTAPTSVGKYTASASFAGNLNHNGSSGSANYEITTGYCFNGFLSPIGGSVEAGTGGTFADPVRAFKLGSTIPIKFILNSWNGSTCGAVVTTGIHTLQAQKYSNGVDGDPVVAVATDAATTGDQFRLTGTEWHFNLSTKGGFSQGTWLLKATLQDGSVKTVWVTIKK